MCGFERENWKFIVVWLLFVLFMVLNCLEEEKDKGMFVECVWIVCVIMVIVFFLL